MDRFPIESASRLVRPDIPPSAMVGPQSDSEYFVDAPRCEHHVNCPGLDAHEVPRHGQDGVRSCSLYYVLRVVAPRFAAGCGY